MIDPEFAIKVIAEPSGSPQLCISWARNLAGFSHDVSTLMTVSTAADVTEVNDLL